MHAETLPAARREFAELARAAFGMHADLDLMREQIVQLGVDHGAEHEERHPHARFAQHQGFGAVGDADAIHALVRAHLRETQRAMAVGIGFEHRPDAGPRRARARQTQVGAEGVEIHFRPRAIPR
jgi:hypothetical protein